MGIIKLPTKRWCYKNVSIRLLIFKRFNKIKFKLTTV